MEPLAPRDLSGRSCGREAVPGRAACRSGTPAAAADEQSKMPPELAVSSHLSSSGLTLLILKFKRTICSVATCVFVLRPFRGPSCVVRSHVQRASEHWQSSALPNLNLSVCVIGLIWLCTGSELVSIATNLNLAVWADHHHCMFRSATVCSVGHDYTPVLRPTDELQTITHIA